MKNINKYEGVLYYLYESMDQIDSRNKSEASRYLGKGYKIAKESDILVGLIEDKIKDSVEYLEMRDFKKAESYIQDIINYIKSEQKSEIKYILKTNINDS